MSRSVRSFFLGILIGGGLAGCGGDDAAIGPPLNVDYSGLRLAESLDTPLVYASREEDILRPLRNGVRLMAASASGVVALPAVSVTPSATTLAPHSGTTVQVEGVDEADVVKYDGQHIYTVRLEIVPGPAGEPQRSRNVLSIARTNPATADVAHVSTYVLEGEQSTTPLIYQLLTQQGRAESLVAVSQDFQGWLTPAAPITALVVQPDRTTIQVLDVRDPEHVSQSWKLELDGWLKASRLIDDTLYLVISYRPRIPGLVLPADTLEAREANERRIRSSTASDLLPAYRENGGARRQLVSPRGCLVAQQIADQDSYTDLVVITAINMRTRRVTDAECLSTNVNGVYMSRNTLYVAGTGLNSQQGVRSTVFHKFALDTGNISYRATGAVLGTLNWNNPSYFMDEHEGDLRVVTTVRDTHHLTVLRETGPHLMLVSSLPNAARPEPIGKPGEAVYAVRFMGERAYVVTFRITDPLYVIDLHDPADPAIAGELEIPGFSTYLRPLGERQEWLLSVGREVGPSGGNEGIRVQLFDVRDIAHPQLIGTEIFGGAGTSSEALHDPHALTFLTTSSGEHNNHRLALPLQVFETAGQGQASPVKWVYSGLHLLEVVEEPDATAQLHFRGVLKTEQASDETPSPSGVAPDRGVLHGQSVFAVHGERILSSLWQNIPAP